MPTLNKRTDGTYFIKFNRGGYGTKSRVSNEAIDFLKDNGVEVHKLVHDLRKITFDSALLKRLEQMNLVSTNGGEFNSSLLDSAVYYPEPTNDAFLLKLEEYEDNWALRIQCPTIPLAWIEGFGFNEIRKLLEPHWLCIADQKIAARRLLSGNRPQYISISLDEKEYEVSFSLSWPFNIKSWQSNIQGILSTRCTLFDGETGIRLKRSLTAGQGHSTHLGQRYLALINPASLENLNLRLWPMPEELAPIFIGQKEEWQSWSFVLQSPVSAKVSDWLNAIGHPLHTNKWKYEIISPPLYYSTDSYPVFAIGKQIATRVSCSLPNATAETARKEIDVVLDGPTTNSKEIVSPVIKAHLDTTFGIELKHEGEYVLRSLLPHQVSSQSFAIAKEHRAIHELINAIQPLQVRWLESSDGIEYHEKRSWKCISNEELPPKIEIIASEFTKFSFSCPIPFRVSWKIAQRRDFRLLEKIDSICEILDESVQQAIAMRQPTDLCVDAGAFGVLSFRIVPTDMTSEDNLFRPLQPITYQRLRWINNCLFAPNTKYESEILIDTASLLLLQKLVRLGYWPQLSQVSIHGRIRTSLWPHLQYVLKALS